MDVSNRDVMVAVYGYPHDDDNDPILRANTLEFLNDYALINVGLEQVKLVW